MHEYKRQRGVCKEGGDGQVDFVLHMAELVSQLSNVR